MTSKNEMRKYFPAMCTFDNDGIVYLDNASTTQKPAIFIESITQMYTYGVAANHSNSHTLSNKVYTQIEQARCSVANFVKTNIDEVVFTKNATESFNLLANSLDFKPKYNGSVVVSAAEHHANLLPWQNFVRRYGLRLIVLPLDNKGDIDVNQALEIIDSNTQIVAVTHCSNVIGRNQNLNIILEYAKSYDSITIVDGTQYIAHNNIDLSKMHVDFYVFSAHKLYCADAVGVLIAKRHTHRMLNAYILGGGIVTNVSFYSASIHKSISKLEAGTPNIAGIIATGKTIDWLSSLDRNGIAQKERELVKLTYKELNKIHNVKTVVSDSHSLISFYVRNIHSFDIASILGDNKIAVRSGHHCAMPLVRMITKHGLVRMSVGMYNDDNDIKLFLQALDTAIDILK